MKTITMSILISALTACMTSPDDLQGEPSSDETTAARAQDDQPTPTTEAEPEAELRAWNQAVTNVAPVAASCVASFGACSSSASCCAGVCASSLTGPPARRCQGPAQVCCIPTGSSCTTSADCCQTSLSHLDVCQGGVCVQTNASRCL